MPNANKPLLEDIETYKVKFDAQYVLKKTKIPTNEADIPCVIGWSGPARSGTTALLYLLASHPDVDRAYFQPQKTIFRTGKPVFELHATDNIVCMKEVFGGDLTIESVRSHDPVGLLLRAGVPASKIIWVTMLRDPLQVFSSILVREPNPNPQTLAAAQDWSLALYEKYRNMGVKMIPYVYELARDYGDEAIKALFIKVNLNPDRHDLRFDSDAIAQKLVPGQLVDPEYFDHNTKDTLERRKYIYSVNNYKMPEELAKTVDSLCREQYEAFKKDAERELGL